MTQNFSTADAIGRLTLNMLMSFAEFEREMIAERTRDKIAAARRKGKWMGGPVPLGYDVIDRKLVINELEAIVAREIFGLYLEHRSVLVVMRELAARGRTTKRVRRPNGDVRAAHPWTKDSVLRVLKNPVYAGLLSSGNELFPAEHPPLIDRDAFECARMILEGHARPSPHGALNAAYLLRGVLRCPCGAGMTPASTRKANREYRYYRCSRREKQGRDACAMGQVPAKAIEDFVIDRVARATAAPRLVREISDGLRVRIDAERRRLEPERREFPRCLARARKEREQLALSLDGLSGRARAVIEKRLVEASEHVTCLETRSRELERHWVALSSAEAEGAWVVEALGSFSTLWEAMTSENRGRLLSAVIESVVVHEGTDKVTMRFATPGFQPLGVCA